MGETYQLPQKGEFLNWLVSPVGGHKTYQKGEEGPASQKQRVQLKREGAAIQKKKGECPLTSAYLEFSSAGTKKQTPAEVEEIGGSLDFSTRSNRESLPDREGLNCWSRVASLVGKKVF